MKAKQRILILFIFTLISPLNFISSKNTKRFWPEIRAHISEELVNSQLESVFLKNEMVETLQFHFNPGDRTITVNMVLNISLNRLVDPSFPSKATKPLKLELNFKPNVLSNGGVGILFNYLIIGVGDEYMPPIQDFSFFMNLFDVLLLETKMGDLLQEKIDLTAEEINRLQELTGSSFEVHLEELKIKNDIKVRGSSVLFKLKLDKLFGGAAMDMSALKKPRLWALEPSLDFGDADLDPEILGVSPDEMPAPQRSLYVAVGETVPEISFFKKVIAAHRKRVKEYLKENEE